MFIAIYTWPFIDFRPHVFIVRTRIRLVSCSLLLKRYGSRVYNTTDINITTCKCIYVWIKDEQIKTHKRRILFISPTPYKNNLKLKPTIEAYL